MSVLFKDKITGLWKRAATNLIYASFPVGSIVAYGGSSDVDAPAGCMYCHGQVLNANDYPDLYDVIGTKFGTGDGSAGSFSLPDLQGQFLRGAGTNRDSTQGSGGTVGQRQKATEIPYVYYFGDGGNGIINVATLNPNKQTNTAVNPDALKSGYVPYYDSVARDCPSRNDRYAFMPRPTNTSVEYIIKVVK